MEVTCSGYVSLGTSSILFAFLNTYLCWLPLQIPTILLNFYKFLPGVSNNFYPKLARSRFLPNLYKIRQIRDLASILPSGGGRFEGLKSSASYMIEVGYEGGVQFL